MNTNVIVLSGRLTAEAQQRRIKDQYDLVTFTIASNYGWGDKEHAIFLDCKWWGKVAASLQQYLTKGKSVTVTGSLDMEEWKDNQGQMRRKSIINVVSVELGASPRDSSPIDPPTDQHIIDDAFHDAMAKAGQF